MTFHRSAFFSLLLVLLVLYVAVLVPRPAWSQQADITVTVPEVKPKAGETATLSVEADLGDDDVRSYSNMEFVFNGSAIDIVDVRDGNELSFGSNFFEVSQEEDTLRVSNTAESPVSGRGEFLQIDVKLAVDGGTTFELTSSDAEGIGVPTSVFVGPDGNDLIVSSIEQGQVGEVAQAQIVHNAADPAVETLDVYIDGDLAVEDLSFREATPFLDGLASGVEIEVGVAATGDDIIADQRVILTPREAHTVVASGVLTPDNFADNPDGQPIPFEFFVEPGAKTTASSGEVELRAVHGATDVPAVDIDEGGTTLFDNLTYGDVRPNYLTATAEQKGLAVTQGGSDEPVAAFDADLSGLSGTAATVLLSGFLDPSANQDGPDFSLIAVLPDGDVTTFPRNQALVVSTPLPDNTLDFPGPSLELISLERTVFDDPDGDDLVLSATSDAPGVVEPTGNSPEVVLLTPNSTGTAQVTVTASDGVFEASTTFQATVQEQDGEESSSRVAALVTSAVDGQVIDFGNSGQKIKPAVEEGSGLTEVERFDSAPDNLDGIEEDNVSQFRTVITASGNLSLKADTEVRFPVEDFSGITDPTKVQVYSRSTPGQGAFESLPTQVDENGTSQDLSDDEIVATTGTFSEFVLASNTEPLPVEMASFDAVRSGSGVELRWTTVSETNNAGFRVEHQPVGQDGWQKLSFVESRASDGTTTEGQSYRFRVENDLEPGTHQFRLRQADLDGTISLAGRAEVEVLLEEALTLGSPTPNPASGQATVSFAVKEASEAKVVVYNVLGQKVRTLFEGIPQAGRSKTLTVETGELPSGAYVLQLRADGQTRTQRLTVVR